MVSLKLSSYTKEEVATLHSVIDEARKSLAKNVECDNSFCGSCPQRHVCYDLIKMQDYLLREIIFDFPHLRKS